jgi:hypothetical protein
MLALLTLLPGIAARGEEAPPTGIAVIAAPGLEPARLDRAAVASIFRRKLRTLPDGGRLVPVNLPADDPLRIAFSVAVFDLEPAALDAYWNERYFHGVSPPHVLASVEAVLRFVAATPGAIGYVPACAVDGRVRLLMVLPVADPAATHCPAAAASPP